MKHLDVLSDAGLIARTKIGRTVTCQLKAEPMEQAMNWLAHYERYWTEQLDRLAAFLEEELMASKPSLALKRRLKAPPEKVYEAWTRPEKMIRWWGVTGRQRPASPRPTSGSAAASVCSSAATTASSTRERHLPRGRAGPQAGRSRWAWQSTPERESQVTIDLKPDGDGTILTLTHEQFFDEKARDDHRRGWSLALDNLEKLFA